MCAPRFLLLVVARPRPRRGFTLFELLVVVVVLAAAAAAVGLSMRGPLEQARMQSAAEELLFLDSQLRSHARRSGTGASMVISLGEGGGVIIVRGRYGREVRRRVSLGRGVRIEHVLVSTGAGEYQRGEIRFTADGRSPTYALELAGSGDRRWLIFAGVTGQQLEVHDQQDVERIFDALAQRIDAD